MPETTNRPASQVGQRRSFNQQQLDAGDLWPPVFREPLDAPYRPGVPDFERRGLAISEGLWAWASCRCCGAYGTLPPENFADVLLKLGRAAGINSAVEDAFSAASAAWMDEFELRASVLTDTQPKRKSQP